MVSSLALISRFYSKERQELIALAEYSGIVVMHLDTVHSLDICNGTGPTCERLISVRRESSVNFLGSSSRDLSFQWAHCLCAASHTMLHYQIHYVYLLIKCYQMFIKLLFT